MHKVSAICLASLIALQPAFSETHGEITYTTTSSKGWSRTITLNQLGQATEDKVEGTGLAETKLSPSFRDDGSLASVSLTVGGATASATFAPNGTLSGFTHPVLGPLAVSHGFAGGNETLAIHGTTATRKLDETASSLTGAGVMDRNRATTISGGQWFEDKITPATGAPTSIIANPAGAKVLHDYAAGADRGMSWLAGGLPHTVSLGRGGAVVMAYSNDGARDLTSITWPTVSSAGFASEPFYGGVVGFLERDDAGNITRVNDPSGERSLDYEKNRLTTTDWLSGELGAYKVVRQHDARGRLEAVAVHRNGAAIHTITPDYTGLSDEVSGMTATGFSATVTRDAAGRHVTGFTRGPVTQRWTRGTAGRITAADTDTTVNGAPWFNYTGFDTRGRRQTVVTGKGTWTCGYRNGAGGDGQLVSATSTGGQLGNFSYNVDGIGRRNFGGNQADALNRFLAITHPQVARKLFLSADPDARLWINGVEAQGFDGALTYQLAHPGTSGGWVPWHVKGVLEDAGDPGAHPDAVAEFAGHLWFPPEIENFEFDDDGNREGSSLWDYGWDGRNKLVRARTKTWSNAPEGWDLEFEYDAEGRRFRKTVTRYAEGSPVEHKVIHFVWDGWDLLFERHEDGNGNPLLERRYVWGPDIADGAAGGAGGLLLIRETRGQTTTDYYPIYDGTGHVVGLTDNAGKLVAEYWWGPFGELIEAKGEMAQANPWRYATKYQDSETGLYYFGHRYYDPVSGQFLSREPLGEDESLNLYAYCHNDPINNVDILGLKERSLIHQFIFGLDPIILEPSKEELARRSARQVQQLQTILMLEEMQDGIYEGGMYTLEAKQEFVMAMAYGQYLFEERIKLEEQLRRGPQIYNVNPERTPNMTAPLTIGGYNTPSMADLNAGFLLPSGAATAGSRYLMQTLRGGSLMVRTGGGLLRVNPIVREAIETNAEFWKSPHALALQKHPAFAAKTTPKLTNPNPTTGAGYGVNDPAVRIPGPWTKQDIFNGLHGRPPRSLGRPDLHHADQMPGSAIHEIVPSAHRGNRALHPGLNQGVTDTMRTQDRQLHWWYRAREQGADRIYPDLIYDP